MKTDSPTSISTNGYARFFATVGFGGGIPVSMTKSPTLRDFAGMSFAPSVRDGVPHSSGEQSGVSWMRLGIRPAVASIRQKSHQQMLMAGL
jgi:hypothetical protein